MRELAQIQKNKHCKPTQNEEHNYYMVEKIYHKNQRIYLRNTLNVRNLRPPCT